MLRDVLSCGGQHLMLCACLLSQVDYKTFQFVICCVMYLEGIQEYLVFASTHRSTNKEIQSIKKKIC